MQIDFKTKDEMPLHGTLYQSRKTKGVVLLNPGTATKTSFYRPFAQYLSEHDFHVLLWNYRGFCESKVHSLVGSSYKYSDIGRYDIPSAIDYLVDRFPNLPLYCVGHSAGSQQIGLANNHEKLAGLVAVASSAGYFPYMPLGYRVKANFFFRVYGPLTGLIFGYVPAKRVGLMEDLSVDMVKEWGEWCKEKELLFSPKFYGKTVPEGAYKDFKFPIHVITADDDEICTERNLESFWKNVQSEKGITFRRYKAMDFPRGKIGHFGYFREENKKVWGDILDQLNSFHALS
jgi:predicted alpha/beta hydrolase